MSSREPETVVIHSEQFHAWCAECPWSGPQRYAEFLAERDADEHDAERHDGR